jgi:hypothetical protein
MSAEISRLTGEMMLAEDGDPAGAGREFLTALALTQELGAKLWELRATTSLAQLRRDARRAGPILP